MRNAFDMLEARGLVEQTTDRNELRKIFGEERMTLYVGIDPTADSLHLGHLFPVLCLARLQRMGHRPISLLGGATAMIGDPSGRTEERQLLAEETIRANSECIRRQLERFLDFSGTNAAIMANNADWTKGVPYLTWLRDVGKYFSVNYMLGKESVRRRIEDRSHGISYTEFSYMLIQANDFLQLFDLYGCRLQAGGNDQWGNITAGIDLIHKQRRAQAYGVTFPLLTASTGEKFGKSAGNAVWLDPDKTSPYALYQYWIRTDDRDAVQYLKYFTFLPLDEIAELGRLVETEPEKREAQRRLAEESTRMIHGEEGLQKARRATEALFGETELTDFTDRDLLDIFADVPSSDIERGELERGIGALTLFTRAGLAKSNSQALSTLRQGGLSVNNIRVEDPRQVLTPSHLASKSVMVLRAGKKRHHLIRAV